MGREAPRQRKGSAWREGLVVEKKLPRAHQSPQDVLERGAFFRGVAGGGERLQHAGTLRFGRRPAERSQESFVRYRVVRPAGGEQLVDAIVLRGELRVQRIAIRDVERLRHA